MKKTAIISPKKDIDLVIAQAKNSYGPGPS